MFQQNTNKKFNCRYINYLYLSLLSSIIVYFAAGFWATEFHKYIAPISNGSAIQNIIRSFFYGISSVFIGVETYDRLGILEIFNYILGFLILYSI